MLTGYIPVCAYTYKRPTDLSFLQRGVRSLAHTMGGYPNRESATRSRDQVALSEQVRRRKTDLETSLFNVGYGRVDRNHTPDAVSRSYAREPLVSKEQTYALYSVDQIREGESPWKALAEIASIDRSTRKSSPFKRRLQERKKIRMLYGHLPKRALDRYLKEIYRPEDLLLVLESRLEIVLKRSALFPSVESARQAILRGGVSVNGTIVRSSRYHCTPGDYIQILQKRLLETGSLLENRSIVTADEMRDKLSHRNDLQDLFVFSELLQLFDRKSGRLYTSAWFDHEATKFHLATDHATASRKMLLKKDFHGFYEDQTRSMSHNLFTQQSCVCEGVKMTFAARPQDTSQKIAPSGKELVVESSTHLNQLYAGEKAESERPSCRVVASRPLHLEVSYRNLCVVFLYPPQRICVDISIDLSLLS